MTTCRVCGHAKWHDLAKSSLNPIALIEFIERVPVSPDAGPSILRYVLAVTGIDRAEMDAALKLESGR